ncbi:hypothetical protein [Neobacillus kokaensis]|uniref:Phage protein n=1 Tax=Neobacillus kokaensis TaxID=2759023 RepID=A0ABQ3NBY6_9BACI|nr:hypothetical protein [Neobacillus kokaensis]GHI01376.1 hypothetical protein AM1BK_49180 [Neobacillus kokaensis]
MEVPRFISREEEAKLPSFQSHEEAYQWFEAKYGIDFVLTTVEPVEEQNCYFYILIVDRYIYEFGQKELEEKGVLTNAFKFMRSHQDIQILEDGSVLIVY